MTYRTEFPDFPAADMPAIPEGFADTSWHNDACPSFTSDAAGYTIWIDYHKAGEREFPEQSRFSVTPQGHGVETGGPSCETDDWDEVLAFLLEQKMAKAGFQIIEDHSEPRQSVFYVMRDGQVVKTAYSRTEAEAFIEEQL